MRLSISVPLDPTTIKQLGPKMERAISFAIRKASIRLQREGRALIPARTGKLRASFKTGVIGDTIQMDWDAPYAGLVDLGVQPHVIRPKGKHALKFTVGGTTVFAKVVNHPGFTGRFYRTRIGMLAMQIMNEEMGTAMAKVMIS